MGEWVDMRKRIGILGEFVMDLWMSGCMVHGCNSVRNSIERRVNASIDRRIQTDDERNFV